MRHAVIMAGGPGARLWPLSRHNRPKQLLRLLGGVSLLRKSFERVTAMFDPDRVYIITAQKHLEQVAQEIPEIPQSNFFGEPIGRDTAAAIGLACAVLAQRDPNAVVGIFTADHVIGPIDRFSQSMTLAFEMAEQNPDALVAVGIKPSHPNTNYGYIRRGEPVAPDVFKVEKFVEKPKVTAAIKMLNSGDFYWNSGLFTWRAATILSQLEKQLPQTHDSVQEIASVWDTEQRSQKLEELYPKLLRISIDFAVMEHAEHALVVEMDCHWVDVGSWPAIETVIGADADGNVNACPNVVHLGSRGNILVSEEKHLIATIGVDDLVIVHTSDATLVCTKRDASGIRELLDNVRQEYGDQYT